jgi:hypothetical protein
MTYCRIVDEEYDDDDRSVFARSNLSKAGRYRAMAAQPGGQDLDGVVKQMTGAENRSQGVASPTGGFYRELAGGDGAMSDTGRRPTAGFTADMGDGLLSGQNENQARAN